MSHPIVADASPLIALARAGLLRLLRDLYGQVLVPSAVHEELEIARRRPGYESLEEALAEGWLAPVAVQAVEGQERLGRLVGRGEREAILLATRHACRFLLIDERSGRAAAEKQGIPVVGTGGVLLAAKQQGLIPSVAAVLDQLAALRFRLSGELRHRLLELAGEGPGGGCR